MTADLESLMLQAQPMRLRIDTQLRHGPASSRTLAGVLGESIELANLRLRQMAGRGFIEEIPELSDGKEHWWRLTCAEPRLPPRTEQTAEMRALIDEINRVNFAADLDDLMRSQLERDENEAWESQLPYHRGAIHVTTDELAEFLEEYGKLMSRFRRPEGDTRADARVVLTRFMAFPAPEPPVADEARPGYGAGKSVSCPF